MRKPFLNLFLINLCVSVFLTVSCKKDSGENGGSTGPEKNVAKGKVTDTGGKPIKGASILIDNTIFYNTHISGSTGGDGTYKILLINGAWQAYASINVTYNGKTYEVDLHPDNSEGFSGDLPVILSPACSWILNRPPALEITWLCWSSEKINQERNNQHHV